MDAEEVARHDLFPMSLQELFPCRLLHAFRSGLDAMPFQNVPDRVVRQIVAEVGQGPLYPAVAPRAILFGHADSQSSNVQARCWPTARSAPTDSVLAGNQISVPRQQSLRRRDRRHLLQGLAPNLFSLDRQSPTLIIVKVQTPVTDLFSKDSILLNQVCDGLLLMAAHPAGNGSHDKRK